MQPSSKFNKDQIKKKIIKDDIPQRNAHKLLLIFCFVVDKIRLFYILYTFMIEMTNSGFTIYTIYILHKHLDQVIIFKISFQYK